MVHTHVCVCGKTVAVGGHHGLSHRFGSERHSRHKQVNNVICRASIKSGTLAAREPRSLCIGSDKRKDGVTQILWSPGPCLAWDVTCRVSHSGEHIF